MTTLATSHELAEADSPYPLQGDDQLFPGIGIRMPHRERSLGSRNFSTDCIPQVGRPNVSLTAAGRPPKPQRIDPGQAVGCWP